MRLKTSPGEVLREEFIVVDGFTLEEIELKTGLSRDTLLDVMYDKKRVNVGIAMALATGLGTTPDFWLNAQDAFDDSKTRMNKYDAHLWVNVILSIICITLAAVLVVNPSMTLCVVWCAFALLWLVVLSETTKN